MGERPSGEQGGLPPRLAFRWLGRRVLSDRCNPYWHQRRLNAALQMEGREPVQGVLVDFVHDCGASHGEAVQLALQQAQERVPSSVLDALAQRLQAGAEPQPRFDPLATRWCVLASPSMNVPRRSLRISHDESRKLAELVAQQVLAGNEAAEQDFLAHCRSCGDALAFMLARRSLVRQGWLETSSWQATSEFLQEEGRAS